MDFLRRCIFRPYRRGLGPVFTLTMWDTGRRDHRGQTVIAYRLTASGPDGHAPIFEGADFAGSPLHADDSDEAVRALMGFLCLRPGDTDPDYFDSYTPTQRAFCAQHAEALSAEVEARFGEER